MQVILLKKVHNLGELGGQVNVKPGYGRNFLIPQGMAVHATAKNIAKFEVMRAELEKAANEALATAKHRAAAMAELIVTLNVKAGEEGKLFGSVGIRDVAEAITAAGHAVEKSEVILPDGSIRQVGEYQIYVQLHSDVKASVKLIVAAQA